MAVGHTIYRMKIMFQQKLPKSDYFEEIKQIFLINIFRSQSTHLKEFNIYYQRKILNLIFGLSYGCRPYNFWMKIIFQQKLTKCVFFQQIKKLFLINIFRSQSNHLKEFTMYYQKKILNLIFGLSCGRSTYHLLNENYLPGKIGQKCKKLFPFI